MKRIAVFGIVIAAALAVIAAIVPGSRPHRVPVPKPVAPVVPAVATPPATPKVSAPMAPAVPTPPPPAATPVVVAPSPPVPETRSEEPAMPAQPPDLLREERNQEKAVDLFADKTLQLEQKFSEDPDADENPEVRRLREFRDRDKDDDARELEQDVGEHLREWMASFPQEVADNLVLVSVDCRVFECQILLAGLSIDIAGQATVQGSDALRELFSSEWWATSFQDAMTTTDRVRNQATDSTGDTMLTIYATRQPEAE